MHVRTLVLIVGCVVLWMPAVATADDDQLFVNIVFDPRSINKKFLNDTDGVPWNDNYTVQATFISNAVIL
jgi:hypothetical protein